MAKHWTKDKRPARQKYWDRRTLEKRKVSHILANLQHVRYKDGTKGRLMTESQARAWWQSRRKTRLPDKYIPLSIQYGDGSP